MDPKKQNLSPELKEVYDRVMNTQAKTTPAAPAPAATSAAPTTPPTQPDANPVPAQSPATTTPVTMPTPPAESPTAPPPPAANTTATTPAAPAPTTFSFSGNKMSSPQTKGGKGKLPPFVIPAGVVILVIAWAAFWAFFFGIIRL